MLYHKEEKLYCSVFVHKFGVFLLINVIHISFTSQLFVWCPLFQVLKDGEQLGLKHFRPVKPLGSGDTGSVHLVELGETGELFAMKAMDKGVMLNRNKVNITSLTTPLSLTANKILITSK